MVIFTVAHFEMEKSFYLHTGQHKQCNYSDAISETIHSGFWWIVLQFSPSLHKLGKFTRPLVSKTGGRGSPGNKASCFLHFMYIHLMWRVCLLCESYLTKYFVPGVDLSLLCLNFAHYVFFWIPWSLACYAYAPVIPRLNLRLRSFNTLHPEIIYMSPFIRIEIKMKSKW